MALPKEHLSIPERENTPESTWEPRFKSAAKAKEQELVLVEHPLEELPVRQERDFLSMRGYEDHRITIFNKFLTENLKVLRTDIYNGLEQAVRENKFQKMAKMQNDLVRAGLQMRASDIKNLIAIINTLFQQAYQKKYRVQPMVTKKGERLFFTVEPKGIISAIDAIRSRLSNKPNGLREYSQAIFINNHLDAVAAIDALELLYKQVGETLDVALMNLIQIKSWPPDDAGVKVIHDQHIDWLRNLVTREQFERSEQLDRLDISHVYNDLLPFVKRFEEVAFELLLRLDEAEPPFMELVDAMVKTLGLEEFSKAQRGWLVRHGDTIHRMFESFVRELRDAKLIPDDTEITQALRAQIDTVLADWKAHARQSISVPEAKSIIMVGAQQYSVRSVMFAESRVLLAF